MDILIRYTTIIINTSHKNQTSYIYIYIKVKKEKCNKRNDYIYFHILKGFTIIT